MKKRPNYIATVKYGKEEIAEREIGDALFHLDQSIIIEKTPHKGVLAIYTNIEWKTLINQLKAHPPATLERLIPITFCCDVTSLQSCLIKNEIWLRNGFRKVRFGRKGSLYDEGIRRLKDILRQYQKADADAHLLVEPLNSLVCFSVVRDEEDKFWKVRRARITTQIF